MKEPDHKIMTMSTFSDLAVMEGQKEEISMVNREVVKLKYPTIFSDNCRYRGAVGNHNLLRHNGGTKSQISLDSAWWETWWTI